MWKRREPSLRASGYVSWIQEVGYGLASPLYDLLVWWTLLPLGGESTCRREFARWLRTEPGQRVASLCCGTGATERAILDHEPTVAITGVDLGASQIGRAQRMTPSGRIDYRVADASSTGLPAHAFERVLIVAALHEMPRELRMRVLREAVRLCTDDGFVLAVEHARIPSVFSRTVRGLWWFTWLPGNPEVATSRDLQRRGLASEMSETGLEILARHTTRPPWLEGILGKPRSPATARRALAAHRGRER